MGRNREVIEPLQEYLRRAPGRPIDHFNLGVCLREAGRTSESLDSFRRALELESTAPPWLGAFLELLRNEGLAFEAREWEQRFTSER